MYFWRLIASVLLLAIGIGGFVAMGTTEVGTRPPAKKMAPLVETVPAISHEDGIQFEVDGVVVPYRQVILAAEVNGRVAFKSEACRTGRAVKKGDVLLKIDERDYQLEVRRLEEELEQANAILDELQVEIANVNNQVDLAKQQLAIDTRELKRNENLEASGSLSESEVDKVRRAELTTRISFQNLFDQKTLFSRRQIRLESVRDLGQSQLDKANLALARTEIRAPLDGVVVSDNVEQDGYVQVGSPVVTLQESSRLDVACKLHMHQMHWLWQSRHQSPDPQSPDAKSPDGTTGESWQAYDFPETAATVIYRLGASSYQWQAVVNRYDGPGVDNQTRMIPCRAHVTNPLQVTSAGSSDPAATGTHPPTLMTGMFVKVRIDARVPIPLIRVPHEAIQPGNVVWSVTAGKLRKHQAQIAYSAAEFVLVYEEQRGLQADAEVVVSPLATPVDGLDVKIVPRGAEGKEATNWVPPNRTSALSRG
jgi:multidrug efflux pump subunit AcrA (membrane-fusion protein)